MQNIYITLALVLGMGLLGGCGLPEAIHSVRKMPDQLDATNDKMNNMGGSLEKTSGAIHMQVLGTALQELDKKENWKALSPVPFGLLPAGKAFAEEATPEELMDFFRSRLSDLKEAKLALFVDPLTGEHTPYVVGTPEYNEIRVEKVAKYMALVTIAGFVQEAKVIAIVTSQIIGDDSPKSKSRKSTALNFLALRHQFIQDILLHASLMDKGLTNVGQVEEAIEHNVKVDAIERMQFSQPIASDVKISLEVKNAAGETSVEVLDFSGAIDRNRAMTDWQALQTALRNLHFDTTQLDQNQDNSTAGFQRDQARVQRNLDIVQQYLGR